jgi:hypothetical protein
MGQQSSRTDTARGGDQFTRWYLTLMLVITAVLTGMLLFFSAVTPLVVGGSGFVGGNLLLVAGIGFVGSLLIAISLPPASDRDASGRTDAGGA